MKVTVVESPGKLAVIDMPVPSPGEGDVLVKMRACGICGTDIEKVYGEPITGFILGHEVVGQVEELGPGVQGLNKGDRIFAHHHVPDYSCEVCARGRFTFCAEYRKHNLKPGGLAEYFILPKYNVERGGFLKLPDDLSYEDASFIEPLACCVLGLETAEASKASSAMIYGAGPIGLMHLKLLKAYGVPKVGIADMSEYRMSFVKQMGVDVSFDPTNKAQAEQALKEFGGGPQLVIVATGAKHAFEDAMRVVGQAGRVLQFGAPKKDEVVEFELSSFFLKGADLKTSYAASEKDTAQALKVLADRSVVVSDLITHRIPLPESEKAFKAALEQRCMKAVITN